MNLILILDSPNATPSQSRTTFNSSPPLGPLGGGDTPSALSGYGEMSPHSLTTNTDDSLSPLTGGGSSSGLPSFPDPAVITPIDGHQVNIRTLVNLGKVENKTLKAWYCLHHFYLFSDYHNQFQRVYVSSIDR